MTEFASPSLVEVPATSSISTLLTDRAERSGDDAVIERRLTQGGPWQPVTARAFDDEVIATFAAQWKTLRLAPVPVFCSAVL